MTTKEPVPLRGHHLRCLLAYVGKGYSPTFSQNVDTVIDAIHQGADIRLVSGADALCSGWQADMPCPNKTTCNHKGLLPADQAIADETAKILQQASLTPDTPLTLTAEAVRALRTYFAEGHNQKPCVTCEWRELCLAIADKGFSGVRLYPDAVPHKKSRFSL